MAKRKQKKGEQKPKSKAFANAGGVITQALERFCLSNNEGKLETMTQVYRWKEDGVFSIAFLSFSDGMEK